MIPINQKNCFVNRKNLGLPDCIIQEGRLTGFIIVPKGWFVELASGEFDKDYVNGKIQTGDFIPVLGAVQAENKTPEATTEEFQGGVKTVVRNGLPEFTFKFVKGGWKWASALYTYNSFQAFDVLFVFSSGAIAGAVSSDGKNLTGFDLGMLNNGTYMFTDGSASSYVLVTIQLTNEVQFNRDVALLDASVLDFNPNFDIQPITDIVMTGRGSVTDSKYYFTANFAMNEKTPLKALQQSNVQLLVNNAVVTIPPASMVYNDATGEYAITPTDAPTSTENTIISLWDEASSSNVTKVGSRMYKGATDSFKPA